MLLQFKRSLLVANPLSRNKSDFLISTTLVSKIRIVECYI